MFRDYRAPAGVALASAAVAGLAGCDEVTDAAASPSPAGSTAAGQGAGGDLLTGNQKIDVGGKAVNVSCAGRPGARRPSRPTSRASSPSWTCATASRRSSTPTATAW
ncbi:hypothetical protein GCM10009546_57180 [Actinomadura livida]|uniref:Lipoprotein n=1 Tax=Actinomadura livida TaxID=79909 RepID=A0A7W7IKW8_9ACTN|nr:hypothetical protein [Actinomadura catellatispora]GGU29981.1 hypothetical protein GCM10010208_63410 [Actinomadura livida]